jgi:hypothetical protein
MINFIILLLCLFSIIILILDNIVLRNKIIETSILYAQSVLDNNNIKSKIFNSDSDLTEKDHLISFLSETREVAFNYIEEVQSSLKEFSTILEKEKLNYNENSIDKIIEAYKKIQKTLPEDLGND